MAEQQLPPALAGDERFAQLCELLAETYADLDLGAMAVYLVDQVKAALLPNLAEQFSLLDEAAWLLAESEDVRRNLIKNAVTLHRYKGTPWSIREVIRLLGFGEVTLLEGLGGLDYDGQATFNGIRVYGDTGSWPVYRVFLAQPITNDQAELLRRVLKATAPARCRLASLEYSAVAIRYNQVAAYDGQYNHGSS
ncbi:phage tail protein [Pseudomonas sp. BN515]|uniref:phage tail protein n=1 Tax=Pseudomonas sp. BN515 TaxID=2567892 RepID=UPI0024583C6B|nr:phage tail protein [Pseudomonas sp. BN515]MDH4869800.1 phage tail protein [Pseudomonas sp. BN515]